MIEFIPITNKNKCLLKKFLKGITDERDTFRYFEKRELNVINQHLITVLMLIDHYPIGYGHLEREHNILWLGIAILKSHQGKKYGSVLMQYLIDFAKKQKEKTIHLSVDSDNKRAINLYLKFGFREASNEQNIKYLTLDIK